MRKAKSLVQRLATPLFLASSILIPPNLNAKEFFSREFLIRLGRGVKEVEVSGDLTKNKLTITASQNTGIRKIKDPDKTEQRKNYIRAIASEDLAEISGSNITIAHSPRTKVTEGEQIIVPGTTLIPEKAIPYGQDKKTVFLMEGGKKSIESFLSAIGINQPFQEAIKTIAKYEINKQEEEKRTNLEKLLKIPNLQVTRISNHNPNWGAPAILQRTWEININSSESAKNLYLIAQIGLKKGPLRNYTPPILIKIPLHKQSTQQEKKKPSYETFPVYRVNNTLNHMERTMRDSHRVETPSGVGKINTDNKIIPGDNIPEIAINFQGYWEWVQGQQQVEYKIKQGDFTIVADNDFLSNVEPESLTTEYNGESVPLKFKEDKKGIFIYNGRFSEKPRETIKIAGGLRFPRQDIEISYKLKSESGIKENFWTIGAGEWNNPFYHQKTRKKDPIEEIGNRIIFSMDPDDDNLKFCKVVDLETGRVKTFHYTIGELKKLIKEKGRIAFNLKRREIKQEIEKTAKQGYDILLDEDLPPVKERRERRNHSKIGRYVPIKGKKIAGIQVIEEIQDKDKFVYVDSQGYKKEFPKTSTNYVRRTSDGNLYHVELVENKRTKQGTLIYKKLDKLPKNVR